MPTRKQRRRRAKSQRHEYEIVYLDEEGNEVEVEPEDVPEPRERKGRSDDGRTRARQPQSARGRSPQPPTWQRSARRSLIMAPFFFLFLYILQRDVASAAIVSLLYAAVFVPFSYGIDRLTYRSQLKRLERR
jgi:hypothetical protein